jgi:hypothetical protein
MSGAFRTTTASTGSGPNAAGAEIGTAAGVFGQQDGLGRSTRIRYDTPVIAGFMASTSHLDSQAWDVALRYSGKFAGTKVKGAVAYSNDQAEEQTGASIAFQHSSGIGGGANFEYINDDTQNDGANGEDPYFWGAHLNYKSKFNEMGSTQLVYMFDRANNREVAGEMASSHSVAVAQNIDAAAMSIDVRFTHAHLEADRLLLDNDTVKSLSIHTRVKF